MKRYFTFAFLLPALCGFEWINPDYSNTNTSLSL